MSNRERWVVYPLLLFTFLMATRDSYVKPEHFDCASITCRHLTVTSTEGKAIVSLGPSEDEAGAVRIYSSRHPIRLPDAEVETDKRRPLGHEIVEMGATDDGGYLRVFGSRPGIDLQLGHDGKQRFSGLTAVDVEENYVAAIAAPPSALAWGSVIGWPPANEPDEGEEAATAQGQAETEAEGKNTESRDNQP